MPRRNLISNIGFGADALHTTDPASPLADLPREDLRFPFSHPPSVSRDERIDAQTAHLAFGASPPGETSPSAFSGRGSTTASPAESFR